MAATVAAAASPAAKHCWVITVIDVTAVAVAVAVRSKRRLRRRVVVRG